MLPLKTVTVQVMVATITRIVTIGRSMTTIASTTMKAMGIIATTARRRTVPGQCSDKQNSAHHTENHDQNNTSVSSQSNSNHNMLGVTGVEKAPGVLLEVHTWQGLGHAFDSVYLVQKVVRTIWDAAGSVRTVSRDNSDLVSFTTLYRGIYAIVLEGRLACSRPFLRIKLIDFVIWGFVSSLCGPEADGCSVVACPACTCEAKSQQAVRALGFFFKASRKAQIQGPAPCCRHCT